MKLAILCIFFIVIALILSTKGSQRALFLFVGLFIVGEFYIGGKVSAFLIYPTAFIVSLLLHGEIRDAWKNFPFKVILCVTLLLHIAIGMLDDRINHDYLKVGYRIFNNFGSSYMALFVGYSLMSNLKEWRTIVRLLFLIFAFVGIYGLFTWFIQSNPYYEMINEVMLDEYGIWTDVQRRGYRVLSTLQNPIVYGFVMCMIAHFVFLWRKSMDVLQWSGLLLLFVINVFLANSRTGVVAGFILVLLFLLSKYRLSWRMYASIASCVLAIAIFYFAIPQVRHTTDTVVDVFTTGGNYTRGSNVELKFSQMTASVYFFKKAPFFGNGFHYFRDELIRKDVSYSGGRLGGMEGYGYRLLVEQGLFMMIAAAIFFYLLVRYFFRRRYLGDYAHAGMAWTVSFLAFILFAGDYGGVFIMGMVLIGLILRFTQLYEVLYISTGLQCRSVYPTLPGEHIGADDE